MRHVIAIDGPAASGKSTVARTLAQRLGFFYVNSGAMYRAVTWHILESGIDPRDAGGITRAVDAAQIGYDCADGELRVSINGKNPAAYLRHDEVNRAVSLLSTVPAVRQALNKKMREFSALQNLVVEGRDIGSVVFPETPFKFYIDASAEVRAHRRQAQGERDEIKLRDQFDSTRQNAPLVVAPNARLIDSSHITIEEVVGQILAELRAKGLSVRGP